MNFHGPVVRAAPTIAPDIGHHELAHDLAMWLSTPARGTIRGRLTWENIQFPDHWSRPDVYSLFATVNPLKVSPTTYEVKVSRGDFRADIRSDKWRSYLPFSAYVFIACRRGLVTADELPRELGLIVRTDDTWIVERKGLRNSAWKLTDRLWLNLCLKGRNPSPFEIHAERTKARAALHPAKGTEP